MNRARRKILLIMLTLLLVHTAQAQRMTLEAAQELFSRANAEYQQQKYAEASQLYGQIISAGIKSPSLFYNMGNTAARLGRTGEAVLYYERARRLSPRDTDVLANLRRVAPPQNDPQHFVLAIPFHWIVQRLSLREWTAFCFTAYILAGVLGAWYFGLAPRRFAWVLRRVFLLCAACALVLGILAISRAYQDRSVRHAVTMQANTPIYSGPGEKFARLGASPEGGKVRRLRFDDPTWARVETMDGTRGFMLANKLTNI